MATSRNLSHGNPNERGCGAVSPLRTPAAARSACLPNLWIKRGQQAIEYAIVIAAISAALTIMYAYVKRGLQQHIRAVTTEEIGGQVQSAPLVDVNTNTSSNAVYDSMSSDVSHTEMFLGGGTRTTYDANSTMTGTTVSEEEEVD